MLNPLPQLLTFTFFAPTILRVTAACVFAYLANYHFRHRSEAAKELSIVNHQTALWLVSVLAIIEALAALGLFFGYYTQIAALVGAVLCLKILLIRKGLRQLAPLSHLSYLLVAAICLSLLLTGAGAVAFDLPL